ncbi:MAG: hypothetical protein SFX19_08160, partial [Alphaproteobacteria bacterium]|nr:hypothetical protein [Alphaproteobacteria bacterium]
MNNVVRFVVAGSVALCVLSGESHAAPWRIAPGENMVMLPPESMAMEPLVAPAAPQAPVAPIDDVNMVSVP